MFSGPSPRLHPAPLSSQPSPRDTHAASSHDARHRQAPIPPSRALRPGVDAPLRLPRLVRPRLAVRLVFSLPRRELEPDGPRRPRRHHRLVLGVHDARRHVGHVRRGHGRHAQQQQGGGGQRRHGGPRRPRRRPLRGRR